MSIRTVLAAALGVAATAVLLGAPANADREPRGPVVASRVVERSGETARIITAPLVGGRLYRGDFPDPSVLRVGKVYYAYGTMAAGRNLPVLRSSDLVHWYAVKHHRGEWSNDALARLPRWAASHTSGGHQVGTVWAPSVARLGPHRYLLAYATRLRGTHKMCVSEATARAPYGPFRDTSRKPLICPPAYGAIDPQFVRGHAGAWAMVWKTDQNAGHPSRLISYRMLPNLRAFTKAGPRGQLLVPTLAWEKPLVENPSMLYYRGRYYLFYSTGSWANRSYATGYAICAAAWGPCTRPDGAATQPLLHSDATVTGPGGAMAFVDAQGRLRLAYAAWDPHAAGYQGNPACRTQRTGCHQRRLHVATLAVAADGTLSVAAEG